ncbi:MAG: hypothetical protein M3T55_13280 [Pseudomonadota bacterium]|nr:hypothetical protein [Pseudomonadota bacterium]
MAKHPKPVPAAAQIDKFRELARELECDDDEEAFRAKFRKVATAPRHPEEPKD